MPESAYRAQVLAVDSAGHVNRTRLIVFLIVCALMAGLGLTYDFSRPAIYRASARISVEPPEGLDAAAKAQFAISESLALHTSKLMTAVDEKLGISTVDAVAAMARPRMTAEAIRQTSAIQLSAEGADRASFVARLTAWVEAYQASRQRIDQVGDTEARVEARHAVAAAEKQVSAKQAEIASFRQRHEIVSLEREENPAAARLKGLHTALNESAEKEVAAEAKLKAIDASISGGKAYVRAADRASIASLEMRAVDLREKMKDMEHDVTARYLALDPKYKALRSNFLNGAATREREAAKSWRGSSGGAGGVRQCAANHPEDSRAAALPMMRGYATPKISPQAQYTTRTLRIWRAKACDCRRLPVQRTLLWQSECIQRFDWLNRCPFGYRAGRSLARCIISRT